MAETTIEWTRGPNGEQGYTFNPWEGCQKVGPGCDYCYAEARNARFGGGVAINWGPGAPRRRTSAANWRKPLAWNAMAKVSGTRPRVFCASLADVFDNQVPAEWRADLFALIAKTPNLDWLLLTKRIGNAFQMMVAANGFIEPSPGAYTPRPNVWLGATIVNQVEADRDIPKLLEVPARVRFLSMEPLLGPVDLTRVCDRRCPRALWMNVIEAKEDNPAHAQLLAHFGGDYDSPRIDWVIAGGESGPGARPAHPDWFRSLRDQCVAAGVPFLFKQWGAWVPDDFSAVTSSGATPTRNWTASDGRVFESYPPHVESVQLMRVGKKAAGRLLEGRTWDGFPA